MHTHCKKKTHLPKFQAADTEGLATKRGPTWGGHSWTTSQSHKEERCHRWKSRETAREALTSLSLEVLARKVDQHLPGVMRKNLSIRRELILSRVLGVTLALSLHSLRKWKATLSGVCVVFAWVSVLGVMWWPCFPVGAVSAVWLVRKKALLLQRLPLHSTLAGMC